MKKLMIIFMGLALVSVFTVSCAGKKTKSADSKKGSKMVEKKKADKKDKAESSNSEAEELATIICEKGSDSRKIEIVKEGGKACVLYYTKFGERSSIANANSDSNYCQGILDRIAGRLKGAGYSCK